MIPAMRPEPWTDNYLYTDYFGHRWRLKPTGDESVPLTIEAVEHSAYLPLRCVCDVDRHDFNCPIHNEIDHPKRGPNGDE